MSKHTNAALARVIDFWEALSPSTVHAIDRVYSDKASFRDPFNDVHGIDAIRKILDHMFDALTDVRFEIVDAARDGDNGFLTWNMKFRLKSRPNDAQRIHGASHIRFDGSGLVVGHRDYWDAGEEVYEKVPVLGALIRLVKRRIG